MKKHLLITVLATVLCSHYSHAQFIDIPNFINIDELLQGINGSKSDNKQQSDIPEGDSGYLYNMGTGPTDRINLPPVIKVTRNYKAGWSAGFGYSCGKFDPFSNVEQMVNQAVNKFKQMPQQFVTAAQGAVAAMPSYLLNKINPTLYNTITKNLDDAFDLFDIKVASCKDIEAGIANHGNSFFDFFQAAKADRQRVEIGKNDGSQDIADTMQNVDEAGADNGVVGAGGERKGGKDQDPFDSMEEVIIAGYNMLINRSDTTDKSAPSQESNPHPVTTVFKSPEEAKKWSASIYGNRKWSLAEGEKGDGSEAKAGVSIRYPYQEHRAKLLDLMHQLVNKNITEESFAEKTGGIRFSQVELSDLRLMDPYPRNISLMIRAQTEGIRDLQQRLRYLREMLFAGLEEPSIIQSTAASKVKQEIMELVGRIDQNLYELSVMNEQG